MRKCLNWKLCISSLSKLIVSYIPCISISMPIYFIIVVTRNCSNLWFADSRFIWFISSLNSSNIFIVLSVITSLMPNCLRLLMWLMCGYLVVKCKFLEPFHSWDYRMLRLVKWWVIIYSILLLFWRLVAASLCMIIDCGIQHFLGIITIC